MEKTSSSARSDPPGRAIDVGANAPHALSVVATMPRLLRYVVFIVIAACSVLVARMTAPLYASASAASDVVTLAPIAPSDPGDAPAHGDGTATIACDELSEDEPSPDALRIDSLPDVLASYVDFPPADPRPASPPQRAPTRVDRPPRV